MSVWKNLILVPALCLTIVVPPGLAMDMQPVGPDQEQIGREPTTAEMYADGLIARPLGLVASVLGAVVFVVTLPFTLPSKSVDSAAKELVAVPAQYTFKRPLGQFDNCQTLPESCK
jgi:hypothetical protein